MRCDDTFHYEDDLQLTIQKQTKIAQVKAAKGKDDDCPIPMYTRKKGETNDNNDEERQKESSLGTYGNGWSEDGRKRYCALMKEVNESRAFYKESFDKRMKKFAAAWWLKEKNLRKKKQEKMFDMTLEINLPSHATIVQQANNNAARLLNETLISHNDVVPI